MTKALTTDPHHRLVNEALPQSIDVLMRTMMLDPYEEKINLKTGEVVRTFSTRINGQALRAALGTMGAVVKLNDQALRRKAGGQLKQLLDAIKNASKRPPVIEG